MLAVKAGVLRREYTYGGALTLDALKSRLAGLTAEYAALQTQTRNAVTQITAPQAGTFSALVDGYETLVNLDTALSLTPRSLAGLLDQVPAGDAAAAGKLVTSKTWNFAALVSQEEGERLAGVDAVTLRFAGGFLQDIPAQIRQVSPAEDGQAVVLLSANRGLEQTTLLRRQTAELIFDVQTGLRVPKSAVRLQTEAEGEALEANVTGVYAVVAGRAEFKPVDILAEGDSFYVVRPAQEGSRALRSGDEIVAQGTGLYDGKLLAEA